jgi:hypothetical protein
MTVLEVQEVQGGMTRENVVSRDNTKTNSKISENPCMKIPIPY